MTYILLPYFFLSVAPLLRIMLVIYTGTALDTVALYWKEQLCSFLLYDMEYNNKLPFHICQENLSPSQSQAGAVVGCACTS